MYNVCVPACVCPLVEVRGQHFSFCRVGPEDGTWKPLTLVTESSQGPQAQFFFIVTLWPLIVSYSYSVLKHAWFRCLWISLSDESLLLGLSAELQ